jgi:putative flippase GtrA
MLKSVFLRYFFSGLMLNGLGFVFFVILLKYLHFSPIISVSIQYPIIICIYYLMQTYFVFEKKPDLKNLVKFLLNIFFLYLLNICGLVVFTQIFDLDVVISQLFITAMLVFINFIIQKKVIYKFT